MDMRAFIGISIPKSIKQKILQIRGKIAEAGAIIKFVEVENLHICLRFLGEINKDQIKGIKTGLKVVSERQKAFDIEVKNLGVFPNMNYIRVIWLGIIGDLEKLVKNINNELQKQGFAKPNKPFKSHLTLGRVKSARNKDELKRILKNMKIEQDMKVHVKEIRLISSVLTPDGPIYTVEGAIPLSDA